MSKAINKAWKYDKNNGFEELLDFKDEETVKKIRKIIEKSKNKNILKFIKDNLEVEDFFAFIQSLNRKLIKWNYESSLYDIEVEGEKYILAICKDEKEFSYKKWNVEYHWLNIKEVISVLFNSWNIYFIFTE